MLRRISIVVVLSFVAAAFVAGIGAPLKVVRAGEIEDKCARKYPDWYQVFGRAACIEELESQPQDYEEGWTAFKRGDYATALREWRPLAEQGQAEAQYLLGIIYSVGKGVPQDYAEVVKWFRKAAEQGHAKAQNDLGNHYRSARGVSQDYAAALKWYRKAAEQGYATAQFNLGFMYRVGRGVSKNYAEALKWYRKAAAKGYAPAQFILGVMYAHGKGVPQDYAEALKWYRKAAAQEHVPVYNSYAWLLATNTDAKFRDGNKAVVLALKALKSKFIPGYLDTLAAAYAEARKFDDAVRVQRQVLNMLRASGSTPNRLKKYQEKLDLYKSNKPYRE